MTTSSAARTISRPTAPPRTRSSRSSPTPRSPRRPTGSSCGGPYGTSPTPGIDQFLDIGSGLPTQGNVHEIVDAAVTCVDYDPMVLSHANALLGGAPDVAAIQADLRRPKEIIDHPGLGLDLSRPVALLVVAILHFVPDEAGPYDIVAEFRDALAPGSHLVLSHLTTEGVPEEHVRAGREAYKGATAPIVPRSKADILRFFDGFALVDPGLAWISEWRPDDPNVPRSHGFAGVARKDHREDQRS